MSEHDSEDGNEEGWGTAQQHVADRGQHEPAQNPIAHPRVIGAGPSAAHERTEERADAARAHQQAHPQHAAAGGVGLILVQWLKAIGATVIGTVSTEAKEQAAREAGADHVIRYRQEDVAAHVREITDGQGVPVTFDGIGMATWATSLKATARRGLIVSYGNAGGPVTGVNLGILAQHGSQFVTRPTLFHYIATRKELMESAASVFDVLHRGVVKPVIAATFPLKDAAEGHRAMESRKLTGSVLLLP